MLSPLSFHTTEAHQVLTGQLLVAVFPLPCSVCRDRRAEHSLSFHAAPGPPSTLHLRSACLGHRLHGSPRWLGRMRARSRPTGGEHPSGLCPPCLITPGAPLEGNLPQPSRGCLSHRGLWDKHSYQLRPHSWRNIAFGRNWFLSFYQKVGK